jgi:hypothetical protein
MRDGEGEQEREREREGEGERERGKERERGGERERACMRLVCGEDVSVARCAARLVEHMSAYVSIRQHTSAYVIRQHTG